MGAPVFCFGGRSPVAHGASVSSHSVKGGVCQNGPFSGGADWQSSPLFGGTNSDTYHQHDVHMRVQRAPPSVIGD